MFTGSTKLGILWILSLLLLFACSPARELKPSVNNRLTPNQFKELDAAITGLMSKAQVPGLSIAVI